MHLFFSQEFFWDLHTGKAAGVCSKKEFFLRGTGVIIIERMGKQEAPIYLVEDSYHTYL